LCLSDSSLRTFGIHDTIICSGPTVFRFRDIAVAISTRLMEELAIAKSKKFEVMKNLGLDQLQIIRVSRFWEAISTNVKVTFDRHGMSLEGTETEITLVKLKMHEQVLSQIRSRTFPFDQFKLLKLLYKPTVLQHFQGIFEQMQLNVACTITANNLVIHGLDDSSVDKAAGILNRDVTQIKLPLDAASSAALSLPQWKDVEKTLRKNAKVLEIAVAADKMSVTCCGLHAEVAAAAEEIRKFFQHNAVLEKFVKMPEGKVKYIQKYLTVDVDNIVKSPQKDVLKLEPIEDGDRSGFVVRGSSHAVEQASRQLVDLSNDIPEVVYDSDVPGTQKFFKTKRGKDSLVAIESRSKVVIVVSEKKIIEEDGDRGAATSLTGSGGKRAAPVMKSEVCASDSNTKIRILKGSVTDCHTQALIVTISEDLKHTDGAAKLVAAAGGL